MQGVRISRIDLQRMRSQRGLETIALVVEMKVTIVYEIARWKVI